MKRSLKEIIEGMEMQALSLRSEKRGYDARLLTEWAADLKELYDMIQRL